MTLNYLIRTGTLLLLLALFFLNYSCKSVDDEILTIADSKLKNIQSEFINKPSTLLELSEDGRPISETDRFFTYNVDDQLIDSSEDTGRFILTTSYSYIDDVLVSYDTPAINSSDMVFQLTGEITYEDVVITRAALFEGEIKYWQKFTFLSTDYRYISKIENILAPNFSGLDNQFEYSYDANFNLTRVNEFEEDPISGEVELKYTYVIEYDDMKNPFKQFITQDPLVFGLLKFSFDSTSLSIRTVIDPMVRRNGIHNITKISQVNQVTGTTFDWNFEYVYNEDDYPIEKKRINENGDWIYNMVYSYY